ncbi:MAG: alpha/beta fold hydrolase [Longimicrobiales bacterium]|nr:alpha/beta fold hydrolase [Longimicrobiales bacterium]
MNGWTTDLLALSRVVLASALGLGLVLFLVQRWIAFPGAFMPSPRAEPTPPQGVEQIWLDTEAGRVEAWLFEAAGEGSRPLIIHAHGNAEFIEVRARDMADLAAHGVHTLAVEFPGYGFSEGRSTRRSIRSTFREAFDRMAERTEVDPDRIVAYGISMGGGAAADLATERPVAALILQSTFSSTMDVARSMLVPGILVRDRFDNVTAVEAFDGPVLLMHGREDDVLGFGHAERIAQAREDLQITPIPCRHNDCAPVWPEIRDRILRFLEETDLLREDETPGQADLPGD